MIPLVVAAVASAVMAAPPAAAKQPDKPGKPAPVAQPAPCAELPCEGADPDGVTAWHPDGEPRALQEVVLDSGARITLYVGEPAWDPYRKYVWAETELPAGVDGRAWLRLTENLGDGINVIQPVDHPRSYRDTSGKTGMFRYDEYGSGVANNACVTDGTQKGCVTTTRTEVTPVGPCEGWCSDLDPATIGEDEWDYLSRPDYRRVELPSGAWTQFVTGRLKQGSLLSWAEGELPDGGRIWLENWQGAGRWGQVWTEFLPEGASRTTSGHTRAFSWLPEMRACVSDGSGTACTRDGEDATTQPTEAPCAELPCEGIDPDTVTEWMPNYDPTLVEDAAVYQGGRLKIYEGRPAWDPYHFYYWAEAELPPGRDGVSGTLMTHADAGIDSRPQRPEPIPGTRLTSSGKTKMVALDPLEGKEIAGLVVDGEDWAFATHQGNNMYLEDVQGPVGPCAPDAACDGVLPGQVTEWTSEASDWSAAELPGGERVVLRGGKPDWSLNDFYAWAHTADEGVSVWLEDKEPGGSYRKVADGELAATTGEYVRACVGDGTETACTVPSP